MKRRKTDDDDEVRALFSNGKYEECANLLRSKVCEENDAERVMIDEAVRKFNLVLCAKRSGKDVALNENELTSLANVAESDAVASLICDTAALLLEDKKNIDRVWKFVEEVKDLMCDCSNDISSRFRMIRSFALASKGMLDQAEQILRKEENLEETYFKAAILTMNERIDDARQLCLDTLERVRKLRETNDPSNSNESMGPIVYLLAHLYMKQDNTSEATRCFRACVHGRMYRPEDSENAEVIAMAKCGQIREAIERSREIVRSQGIESLQGRAASFNMALLYASVDHYAESLRIFRDISQCQISSISSSSSSAKETTIKIKIDEDVKVTRELVHRFLGDAAVRAGHNKDAVSTYEQMPRSHINRVRHAFALLQSGKYEDVISMMMTSHSEKNNANMLMYEADALVCTDQVSEALSRIEKILDLEDKSSLTHLVARHNRALMLLCLNRVDEAVKILSQLHRLVSNREKGEIPDSIVEQIHFNYTLALWKIGKSTTACTQWLVSRGFVASKQDDVELSPATVGHLDRFSSLLDIQRAALAKEKSKQNGAIIISHVNAASPPVPQRPDTWSDTRNMNKSSVMRNRVSKFQLLALDVKVLTHWCRLQQNKEFSKSVMIVEKGL